MLRRALGLLGLIAVILAAVTDARAERRVALVIGNAHYEHASTLRNPLNDAQAMAALLKTVGFEVVVGTDLDQRAFAGQVEAFGRLLEGAEVGLFFYAGHGLQVNEKNYLVSTQAKLESEFLIPAETVELDAIIRLMESRSRVNLVFLDACRNNPLADKLRQNLVAAKRSVSLGRGLARIEPTGRDTLIAFAAAPGQEAADGRDRHSPFTAALLQNVPKPGVEVSVMLKEVTAQVRRETNNSQRPQQLSDMSRTFYFAKAEPIAAAPPPPPKVAQATPDHSIELAYWNSARSVNDCESVRAYLERFPNGIFTDLARLSERRLCDPTRKVIVVDAEPPPVNPEPPAGVTAAPSQVSLAPSTESTSEPAVTPETPTTTPSAETTIAALPKQADPTSEPASDADSSAVQTNLTRDLQRELARVGCAADRADGIWGSRSRDAVREFNRHARASLESGAPSKDALAAVQKHQSRVCPPEPTPTRSKRETVRPRERSKPVERETATAKDWRSISPLCQSAFPMSGRMCCTYDPPDGAPRIICP